MSRPEVLIEEVCTALSSYIGEVKVSGDIDDRLLSCYRFVESLCENIPQSQTTDMSYGKTISARNACFAFSTQKCDECCVALLQTPVKYNEMECAVVVNNVRSFDLACLDKIRQKLGEDAKIVVSSLLVVKNPHSDIWHSEGVSCRNGNKLFKIISNPPIYL